MTHEPQQRERGGGRGEIAETHDGARLGDDDAGVHQADEGDEQADAARHGGKQRARHRVHDELPHAEHGQDQERGAGEKHAAERRLPRQPHALDHREGEVGVESHARRHRQRIVRDEAHQDAAESRGEAGGRGHRRHRHAGLAQDHRIDHDDVGHGEEGGQPGEHLGAHRRAVGLEREKAVQHTAQTGSSPGRLAHRMSRSLPRWIIPGRGSELAAETQVITARRDPGQEVVAVERGCRWSGCADRSGCRSRT